MMRIFMLDKKLVYIFSNLLYHKKIVKCFIERNYGIRALCGDNRAACQYT